MSGWEGLWYQLAAGVGVLIFVEWSMRRTERRIRNGKIKRQANERVDGKAAKEVELPLRANRLNGEERRNQKWNSVSSWHGSSRME